ncbi:MAG: ribonuclease HII [Chitinophagales bacterium]
MLLPFYQSKLIEAGCDEAGRGCLAGPVFAAAVILPKSFRNEILNDSKKLSRKQRDELRLIIEDEAIDFAVVSIDNNEIDKINILNASILAMHRTLDKLKKPFEFIIVDGNRFKPYKQTPHQTIVKGDGKYLSIAAASVLAKTYRDEFMEKAHEQFPEYDWISNKGYGVEKHRKAIIQLGTSPLHRKSFVLKEMQGKLF